MSKVKDMYDNEINIGDKVRKHSIIGDDESNFKEGRVVHLAPMHSDGELMVWAGSGGAHHPEACVVIEE